MGWPKRARSGRWAWIAVLSALALGGPLAGVGHAASLTSAPVPMYALVPDGSSLKVVRFSASSSVTAQAFQSDAAAHGAVVSASTPVHALDLGDPYRAQQWALSAVDYPDAWALTKGAGITVAVVDSGVMGTHEDLAGSVLQGTDFVSPGNGWNDQLFHGTFVAGIVAAHLGNGRGIAGAAPSVKILPVRVLDGGGSGNSANVAAGIIYAADHGARVINLSLGGPVPDVGVHAAVQYAISKGAVVVAAAGNQAQSGSPASYPAAFPEVLAVGAVDSHLQRADFSNVGSYVDVVAPGVDVMSTYFATTHSYAVGEGTSFAAPYASAEAALILATNPKLDAGDVRHVMEISARDLGPAGPDAEYGYGLISTHALLRAGTNADEGTGYWVASADGSVRALGAAHFYGDMAHRTSSPIVASARTPSGHGYWLAAADGSVYAFGDAHFHGSMHGRALNSPIVGMAATPTGGGYYLLGRDGGIFTFGDAHFYGSTGNRRLNAPVLDMTTTASGHGYWMVAGDGGIFTFGVPFAGSVASLGISAVVGVRIRAMPSGKGYLVLSREGGVYSFGSARFFGSPALSAPAVDLMTYGA